MRSLCANQVRALGFRLQGVGLRVKGSDIGFRPIGSSLRGVGFPCFDNANTVAATLGFTLRELYGQGLSVRFIRVIWFWT